MSGQVDHEGSHTKGPAHKQPSASMWLLQGYRDEILRRKQTVAPPQSLCLCTEASCTVLAEDQGPL